MQCRNCGAPNPDSNRVCSFCDRPIPATGAHNDISGAEKNHSGRRQISPAYSQFGFHSPADTLRRTRHLSGSTSSISSSDSVQEERPATAEQPHVQPTRTEPRWEGASIPPFANAAYEQEYRDAAWFARYTPRSSNRLSRVLLMIAIFAIGAGVGLGAAWWVDPGSLGERLGFASEVKQPQIQRGTGVEQGSSASELPYDGAPPPVAATPSAGAASTSNAPGSAGLEPRDNKNSSAGENVPAQASAKEDQAPPDKSPIARTARPQLSAASTSSGSREPKQARSVRKHRSIPKPVRNREIDRIRQQADEELKKKTESNRRVEEARTGSRARSAARSERGAAAKVAGTAAVMRARFARCDQAANLFRREQCRWKVCGGMWGRNGCPSYATASNSATLSGL